MSFSTLTDLANLHGTDKGTIGPSSDWAGHNYTEIYEAYLERRRFAELSVLEIGLGVRGDRWDSQIVRGRNGGGASVKMWHDYFPKAMVYGIDVNSCEYLDNDRIKTFVADQGNLVDLAAFTKASGGVKFDVIIDDGSHRPDHQQISLSYFFPSLKPGGLYFIEDLCRVGLGDDAAGRHTCGHVRNTRDVLKYFREHGAFLAPNALSDAAGLAEQIAYINFHKCEQRPSVSLQPSLRHPLKKAILSEPDTELLCMIEKRRADEWN